MATFIQSFCDQYHIPVPEGIVTIKDRHFRIDPALKPIVRALADRCEYAGELLGFGKDKFVPSAIFLDDYLSKSPDRIVITKKGAWMFICGRDVFANAVLLSTVGAGQYGVVVDEQDHVLGYGMLQSQRSGSQIGVKNVFDRGILLRRELTGKKPKLNKARR